MHHIKTCGYCGFSRVYMVKAIVQQRTVKQIKTPWICFPCFLNLVAGSTLLEKNKSMKQKFMQTFVHKLLFH